MSAEGLQHTKRPTDWIRSLEFFGALRWIDGTPLMDHIEPYRRRIFEAALDTFVAGRLAYNLVLSGRSKKNWKSTDEVLAGLDALVANDSPGGNQVYLFANDEGQANDDLALAKLLVAANPEVLATRLIVQKREILRADGQGFMQILPAQNAVGAHGKTYRFAGFDEIHGHRSWDLLEATQLDPTRPDAQMWVTSYASIYHKPGVPLFDMFAAGRAKTDPRMYFSWYSASFTTDEDFANVDPETRANPSRDSWGDPEYLPQQKRRLPAHKYRRLHLNEPGVPEGSAFQPEPVMAAVDRKVPQRPPEPGRVYRAFVDMSGGSSDDAVLAIGYRDEEGRVVVAVVMNQGPPPPFDPRAAVVRFAEILTRYGIRRVVGDKYAGETFVLDFERAGITYRLEPRTTSQIYEALEPRLNAGQVRIPDQPMVEQQLLGLVWRSGRIDHPAGEHDDWANSVAGLVNVLAKEACTFPGCGGIECEGSGIHLWGGAVQTVPQDVHEAQAEADEVDRERAAASAAAIAEGIRKHGWWTPGQPTGRWG